jgi:hypothetical protein
VKPRAVAVLTFAVLVAPLTAEAQQAGKIPRIGLLVPDLKLHPMATFGTRV